MGDQKNPGTMPMSLPPGCRFYPSEEELLRYLTQKYVISDSSSINDDDQYFGVDLIKEINLYGYDPFDLPDTTCFRFGRGGRKRHWYCYTARAEEERGIRRKTAGGYWKRRSQSQLVVRHGGKAVLGTKTSYVFYFLKSPRCVERTDWMMQEYDLVDHPKVPISSVVIQWTFFVPILTVSRKICFGFLSLSSRWKPKMPTKWVLPQVLPHESNLANRSFSAPVFGVSLIRLNCYILGILSACFTIFLNLCQYGLNTCTLFPYSMLLIDVPFEGCH